MRMLLVEDNRQLAEMLTKGLQAAGYDADHLATSAEARSVLTTTRYAALILDLGLPDGDGLSILREVRDRKDPLPILVLTARASVHDRVSGLRSGADDYLVKPFDFDELVARLEALLRRPGRLLESSLQVGNLTFDTESRQVFIDDIPQVLFAREATVLELLMRHKGRVVSKKLVEDHVFGSHCASRRMPLRSMFIVSAGNFPVMAPRSESIPSAVWDTFSPRAHSTCGSSRSSRELFFYR